MYLYLLRGRLMKWRKSLQQAQNLADGNRPEENEKRCESCGE